MTPDLLGQAKAFFAQRRTLGGLAVVGDLCIDRFVFGSVDRISPEAPVPVLHIERTEDKLGCAANVAENLAALRPDLDFDLDLIGVAGKDPVADTLIAKLTRPEARIRAHVVRDASRPTTLKTRFIAGSQHQLLRVDDETTRAVDAATIQKVLEAVEAQLPTLKCLVLQDYAKGLFSEDLLGRLLAMARAKGVLTLVDPNRHTPASHYTNAGLITPNVSEAEAMLARSLGRGADSVVVAEAAHDLKRRLKLDMAIITRSGHGMTLVDRDDKIHHFPAVARAVYDVTGAGDTVVAVLGAAFAAGASPGLACTLATVAASVVVGKVGTATASVPEILRALDSWNSKV